MRYLLLLLLLTAPAWADQGPCAVCSVEQGRLHSEDVKAKVEHEGATYTFCQEGCKDRFLENPEPWVKGLAALSEPAAPSGTLPSFRFPLEPAGSISSEDVKGKVLVLNFWATWCVPCVQELPDLVKLQETYGDRGLVVLGISFDKTQEAHRDGVRKFALNYPSIFGETPEVQSFLEKLGPVEAIPVTLIVGADGTIVKRLEGRGTYEEFVEAVEPLLPQEEAAQPASGGSVAPS